MIKAGLTGGIGSGKSTVARLFAMLDVPVFDSDTVAKSLYHTDLILKARLIEKFGPKIYLENGQINKSFLISEIFSHAKTLEELNALVHPRVKASFDHWVENNSNFPILIKEAAILFESGADKQVDKKIVVVAPLEVRISRVMIRDSFTRDKVMERIKNQLPQEELVNRADFVIDNSGKVSVIKQVINIHKQLLNKIGK